MPGDSKPQASDQELMKEENLNMNAYHRMNQRPAYDGMIDKFGEIRLRLATIDDPEATRTVLTQPDPLDIKDTINVNNGKVKLRWVDVPGGVVRPNDEKINGTYTYNADNDSVNPEERDWSAWNITSAREMVDITSPFIWNGDDNYCGINFIPPVGSKVIVGFRKQGFPLILGYLPTQWTIMYPVLKPGETCIKGFGNNYVHFRSSDKLDLKAWSGSGGTDLDDPNGNKPSCGGITLWIRLNANDGYIRLSATDGSSGKGSAINMSPDSITVTTGTYNLQVRDLINIDSPIITQN